MMGGVETGWAERVVRLLTLSSDRGILINAGISKTANGFRVFSDHLIAEGETRSFSTDWEDGTAIKPEYAWGLSVVHDAKDHYFWGMPISQMAEFQAICQIQLGRALLAGDDDWPSRATAIITGEIERELFAEQRPRIYTPGVPGVLALSGDPSRNRDLEQAIKVFCTEIVCPELIVMYARLPDLLNLQRSVRENLLIGSALLPGLRWYDVDGQTLRLTDNVGFSASYRATINEDCLAASQRIRVAWYAWLDQHHVDAEWLRYPLFGAKRD